MSKKILLSVLVILALWSISVSAGVLMQAFYWNTPIGGAWYDTVTAHATELKNVGITAIWLPPPSKGMSGGYSMGYDPFDLYDLGEYNQQGSIETRFGSKAELKTCVSTYRSLGMDVYLDMVLNHMSGGASEYNPNKGTNTWTKFTYIHGKFQRSYNDFHPSTYWNYDEGDFAGMPDVCHRNPYVKNGLIEWGNWLKTELGVNGWRFDYVKGFGGWVVKDFIEGTGNMFAVGECWDSNIDVLNNWINSTGGKSNAFDFALFYTLKDMCNNTTGSFDMARLDHAGLVGVNPFKAVTFVENHDTDQSDPIVSNKEMAYAYILTAEGIPTVFWKDYYNYGLKSKIDPLIQVHEKFAGGATTVLYKDSDLYIAQREGYGANPGCLVALNDNASSSKQKWVQTKWKNTLLKEKTNNGSDKTTDSNGWVVLTVPKRGYVVYVPDATTPPPQNQLLTIHYDNANNWSTVKMHWGPSYYNPVSDISPSGSDSYGPYFTVNWTFGDAYLTACFTNGSGSWDGVDRRVNKPSTFPSEVWIKKGDATVYLTKPTDPPPSTTIPVTFTVNSAYTIWGQNVYVVGNIAELGSWNTANAKGPLSCPNYPTWTTSTPIQLPAGKAIEYKYIKKDGSGNVIWEGGSNHTYTVPTSGSGSVNDTWQEAKTSAPIESETITSVKEFELNQNYPNPFNINTSITYSVPKPSYVVLSVYNSNGQLVRRLTNSFQDAGNYTVIWDGKDDNNNEVSNGLYVYKLTGERGISITKTMVLVK